MQFQLGTSYFVLLITLWSIYRLFSHFNELIDKEMLYLAQDLVDPALALKANGRQVATR